MNCRVDRAMGRSSHKGPQSRHNSGNLVCENCPLIASSNLSRRTLRCQDRVEQSRAPLFEAIRDYAALPKAAFHTPGHKQGQGTPAELLEFLGENVFRADLTELPEVDNLHDPDGAIREAQALAASAYGADRSWFLVNGSTCGVETLMMAVCDPGDVVLLPRNCHKSAIAGGDAVWGCAGLHRA